MLADEDDRRVLLAEGGVVLKQWSRLHDRADRELAALELLQAAGVAAPRALWVAHSDRDGVLLAMTTVRGVPLESALRTASPLDARRVLGALLDRVGSWLDAGITHGGLRAADVLVDDSGGVGVVGWGGATVGPGAPHPSAGQLAWFGDTDEVAADVVSVGALLARFAATDDLLHRLAATLAAEPTIESLREARRQLPGAASHRGGDARRPQPSATQTPPLDTRRLDDDAPDAGVPSHGSFEPSNGDDRPPLLLDEPAPTVVRDGRAAALLADAPRTGLLGVAERVLHPSLVDRLAAALASARSGFASRRRTLLVGVVAFALAALVGVVALRQLSPQSHPTPPSGSASSQPIASESGPVERALRASAPREAAPALLRAWARCTTANCAERYAVADALLPDPPVRIPRSMRVQRVQRIGDLALVDVRVPAGHAAISVVETDDGWRLRAYSPPP